MTNTDTLSQLQVYHKAISVSVLQFFVTGSQVRMARAGLRLSIRDVAEAAQVSPTTVTKVEADQPVNTSTLAVIRQALERAGAEFRPDGSVIAPRPAEPQG